MLLAVTVAASSRAAGSVSATSTRAGRLATCRAHGRHLGRRGGAGGLGEGRHEPGRVDEGAGLLDTDPGSEGDPHRVGAGRPDPERRGPPGAEQQGGSATGELGPEARIVHALERLDRDPAGRVDNPAGHAAAQESIGGCHLDEILHIRLENLRHRRLLLV